MGEATTPISSVGGKPSMISYSQEDSNTPFATTKQHILENYPFVGILLKKVDEYYRIKATYSKSSPGSIEEVEEVYTHGDYKLRVMNSDREQHDISFSISPLTTFESPSIVDSNRLSQLEIDTQEQKRKIASLESRIEQQDIEIDEKQKKIRDLNTEIIETERTTKSRYSHEIESLEDKNKSKKKRFSS